MPPHFSLLSIDDWLADLHDFICEKAPELLTFFEVYSNEARFGRQFIEEDLRCLQPGASILEIGAGSLLLSCQLVREGFDVTALEPIGSGFSHFERMRKLVLAKAQQADCCPKLLDIPAESLSISNCFDFVFSINVMEHVLDVAQTISNACTSLKPGAAYRFTCPNYLFPYEPHFNCPTLFSKKLTERVLGKWIFGDSSLSDPRGTWKSLNWINVAQIRREIACLPNVRVEFSRKLLVSTFARVAFDKKFAERRAIWMRIGIRIMVNLHLHYLVALIPALLQPIIDCKIIRDVERES